MILAWIKSQLSKIKYSRILHIVFRYFIQDYLVFISLSETINRINGIETLRFRHKAVTATTKNRALLSGPSCLVERRLSLSITVVIYFHLLLLAERTFHSHSSITFSDGHATAVASTWQVLDVQVHLATNSQRAGSLYVSPPILRFCISAEIPIYLLSAGIRAFFYSFVLGRISLWRKEYGRRGVFYPPYVKHLRSEYLAVWIISMW